MLHATVLLAATTVIVAVCVALLIDDRRRRRKHYRRLEAIGAGDDGAESDGQHGAPRARAPLAGQSGTSDGTT